MKGWWDNFPDICENCNLAVLLMMSWREDSLRGIGPKGPAGWAKVNWASWSHNVALRNTDTSYKRPQIWIVGSERDCSLSQLLVSSWSNFTDLKGNRGNEGWGCSRGQILVKYPECTDPPQKPLPTSSNSGHFDPQWGQRVSGKKCDMAVKFNEWWSQSGYQIKLAFDWRSLLCRNSFFIILTDIPMVN